MTDRIGCHSLTKECAARCGIYNNEYGGVYFINLHVFFVFSRQLHLPD